MRKLTPLEQVTAIDAALRKKLEAYWITSVEELASTARAGNATHGSGRRALALALGISEEALAPVLSAANALLPPDVSFSVPVGQEYGDGLFLDEYRDVDAASFSVPISLPPAVEPLFALPKPQNQGVRNSCVAFTLAAAYQILSKDATDLSEQFLYWAFKSKDGIPGDVGTDPIKAAQVLQTVGVCSEAAWPYQPAPSDSQNPGHGPPPPAAVDEAQARRIKGFQKLPGTGVNAIKAALAQGKPVLIGLRIYEHWAGSWQGSTLGRLRAPLPGERQRGGHAMCVVGYRDDATAPGRGYFIVRNSWGPDWGKENLDGPGYCHVPYKLVSDQGLAAIAIDGVVAPPAPAPAPGGGATAAPGKRARARARLGGAEASLEELYAEAKELHARMGDLVAGLAALLGAPDEGDAAPEGARAPGDAVPAALAPEERASRPVAAARPAGGAPALIFSRLGGDGAAAGRELYPNGISPEGRPLLRIDAAAAADLALNKPAREPRDRVLLYKEKRNTNKNNLHLGAVSDIDLTKLEQGRWAIVINARDAAALIKALWPLVEHRMRQMGHRPPEVTWRDGESAGAWYNRHSDGGKKTLKESWGQIPPVLVYRPGEKVSAWLARAPHGVANTTVDPRRGVPFYLMLVGRPGPLGPDDETFIPLSFQYELDIFWGVGRVCFTDAEGQHRLADYTRYAEGLAALEGRAQAEAAARMRKEVVYLATRHEEDRSTQLSADGLVRPLAAWSANPENTPLQRGFGHSLFTEAQASRSNLERILRGGDDGKAPALLFSATHGLGGLPLGDRRLVEHTGSLVLADWSGFGNVEREHWFAGEDLAAMRGDLRVEGGVAFLFACYGAGCPAQDEFIFERGQERPQIAPFPLIAQLPQQLLLGGAIGVLGHVERAWTYSFQGTEGVEGQSQPFEDVLGQLMKGRCLGHATDQFNAIQGARALALTEEIDQIDYGRDYDPYELARLWMARNDARNYALLGDPAARLPYEVAP